MKRPEGHEPSYPAYSVQWPASMTHIVFAQLGVQAGEEDPIDAITQVESLLTLPSGPRHVDCVEHLDGRGYRNRIFLAYWDAPATYEEWAARREVTEWWNQDTARSPLGHWREIATVPTSRIETLHSGENRDNGCSHFLPIELTPYHDYWGGARDRILASHSDELQSPLPEALPPPRQPDSRGRRIRVTAPDNVCLIRTAQDWTRCGPAERATYIETVEPVLATAADFIRDHPEETGCISARYVRELDPEGAARDESCVIAYWLSLGHLERWTVSHPTHQAIFATFYEMLQKHEFRLDLALWHEISVLPAGSLNLEYVNCHRETGFLPFFDHVDAAAEAIVA
jgi:hypothetical protein